METTVICETCLKAAVCTHKPYRTMLDECRELRELLYLRGNIDISWRKENFVKYIQAVENSIKPKQWKIHRNINNEVGPKIRNKFL